MLFKDLLNIGMGCRASMLYTLENKTDSIKAVKDFKIKTFYEQYIDKYIESENFMNILFELPRLQLEAFIQFNDMICRESFYYKFAKFSSQEIICMKNISNIKLKLGSFIKMGVSRPEDKKLFEIIRCMFCSFESSEKKCLKLFNHDVLNSTLFSMLSMLEFLNFKLLGISCKNTVNIVAFINL